MLWKENLAKVGLDESNMPKMIRRAVDELEAFQKEMDKITNLLERDDLSDNKREQLEEDYDNLEASVENQEIVIDKKIAQWSKNKDGYAIRGHKLAASRLAKQQAKRGGQVQSTQVPPPQPPQLPAVAQPISVQAEEMKNPPKKSSGWGWLVLIGVVAIVSLGAINLSKDE